MIYIIIHLSYISNSYRYFPQYFQFGGSTEDEKVCKNFMLENNGKLLKVTVWPQDYDKTERIGKNNLI